MLQLYFFPMACSLSSRIALMEAGIEAQYHLAHIWTKQVVDDGSDFLGVSPKGAVPVLALENGERLTESAAVLQYIADVKPTAGLAPAFGDPDRYRLQEWLSFIGAEIHKAFLFPTFWYKDDGSLAKPRVRITQTLSVPSAHLAEHEFLVGDSFTVADAHLTWALLLLRPAGVDIAQWPSLSAYLGRMQARPAVREAIATEMALRKAMAA
ncbi:MULTISPECIES: glutathione binding-like protein [Bradyrhizobium]|jgi:glutathione S-transferase|uniref:Glutathione S-transferase n=1 Tax=Bradyrhizobium ottawaense TaxID=931866 RepID=A0ABV4G4I4_9BRAD|nr:MULTISPECIES: glutathione binding-like protein [Bradyrhizobium]MBR1292977.1 glutathione S-transferase family protein [Bradyrhizobium ottawaense]MDA9486818.1 glutathione S-transferase [Bradyrhizobium sp. CCBAU 11445]WLB43586.1 glutathione binding-like protein [Bradyrhizobium ottawaense]WQN80890.1 glutathione binding-like protein [Bradyrhizobium ottawaense]BBO07315.1 glutathione S-transferase [Bradyrhizobium ottawaense]